MVSKAGRAANRKRKAELAKRPNLKAYYGRKLSAVEPGGYRWRITAIRPGLKSVPLDPYVDSLTWIDAEAKLSGTLTLNRPTIEVAPVIGVGYRVRLDVGVGVTGWKTLWEMDMLDPGWDLGAASGTVGLEDDLGKLDTVKMDWSYRKTKKRGRGWTCDEIAADVAKRTGIKIGALALGKKQITKLVKKNTTALDIIRMAYQEERDYSKQRFVIRLANGKIEILALARNTVLYTVKEQLEGATVDEVRSADPYTRIEAKGRVGKGKDAKKVSTVVSSRVAMRRHGKKTREKDYGRVDSVEDLRNQALRDLAKGLRVKRTGSLSIPGIPELRRGDGLRWLTDEPGWHGQTSEVRDRSYVFAASVSQTLTPDGLTTDVDVIQDDPYVKALAQRDKDMRAAARARRKKRKTTR